VVFDEAHEMEDVASDYFGRQISNFRFEELARDADQTLRLVHLGTPSLREDAKNQGTQRGVFRIVSAARRAVLVPEERARKRFLEQNREAHDSLVTSLKSMETDSRRSPRSREELTRIARRSFRTAPGTVLPVRIERAEFRLLVRAEEQRRILTATPIERPGPDSAERLFERFDTVILTSATLTVEDAFVPPLVTSRRNSARSIRTGKGQFLAQFEAPPRDARQLFRLRGERAEFRLHAFQ